jgi:uroporphyrinogen-III synthase
MSQVGAPLRGRTIAVTRPQAQAAPLVAAITAAGGEALCYPLLEIAPLADPAELRAVAPRLADYALAVFISPNAVAYALPTLRAAGPWPANLRPAAVGPGTAAALADEGIADCLLPETRFDSEGLLARPELAANAVNGRKVLILRGDGGRELLADTLRQRGAIVDCVSCYRRSGPAMPPDTLLVAARRGQLAALTCSSSEGLRYLSAWLDDAGRSLLQTLPLFVPHPRIAEQAVQLGWQRVVLTGAAEAGLIQSLLAYNWSA